MLQPGKSADGLYITLTGHVDVVLPGQDAAVTYGAGTMFGHASLISNAPSELNVLTRDNLLLLRLPRASFSRIVMQYSEVLGRLSEFDPVASVSS